MSKHKWFVAISATMVAFFVWVNPAQADPGICCMWEDPPNNCCPRDECDANCGGDVGCTGCSARGEGNCFGIGACCDESTGECHWIAGACCALLGFTGIGDCEDCEARREEPEPMSNASPAYEDDVDEAETSEDQATSGSVWVLVAAALLLLPAVPIVMRRRAARQK